MNILIDLIGTEIGTEKNTTRVPCSDIPSLDPVAWVSVWFIFRSPLTKKKGVKKISWPFRSSASHEPISSRNTKSHTIHVGLILKSSPVYLCLHLGLCSSLSVLERLSANKMTESKEKSQLNMHFKAGPTVKGRRIVGAASSTFLDCERSVRRDWHVREISTSHLICQPSWL